MKIYVEPCKKCGKRPILEHWHSGGIMYMVRCDTPTCDVPIYGYPSGRNVDDVINAWNERQSENYESQVYPKL